MHKQDLIKFHEFIYKILVGNEILTTTKGHDHVVNLRKLMYNNLNLYLVMVNACAKCDQISSIRSEKYSDEMELLQ